MKTQSISDTDRNTIDIKEKELKQKGFRQSVNEYEVGIGTYYRSETQNSNPQTFEGPPSYAIKWGE